MKRKGQYRIRWATVYQCKCYSKGYTCWPARMCIAERRVRWLWLFPMWWPTPFSEWRMNEAEAQSDIMRDIELRYPMPAPWIFDPDAVSSKTTSPPPPKPKGWSAPGGGGRAKGVANR